jgi:hypothetical protein
VTTQISTSLTLLFRYFLNGNCLAGETCLFSHDPSALMARMAISDVSTPPLQSALPNFQMSDYEFPTLHSNGSPFGTPQILTPEATTLEQLYGLTGGATRPPPGLSPFPVFTPGAGSRPQSRTFRACSRRQRGLPKLRVCCCRQDGQKASWQAWRSWPQRCAYA